MFKARKDPEKQSPKLKNTPYYKGGKLPSLKQYLYVV